MKKILKLLAFIGIAVLGTLFLLMIIHGEADDFVPCQMSHDNYDSCVSRKEILTIPGAGHGMSYCIDSKAYVNAVQKFIDSIMQEN